MGGIAVTAELIIAGIILLAMICVSWYGWVTLPSDARVPIHFGISYNNFVPKHAGLIIHPLVGAVVFAITATTAKASAAGGAPSHGPPGAFLLVAMGVVLIVQVGAIRVARRRSGGSAS
jgi:4-amino-4-deoxy-L-arabinose transferase-like glycosyltransferase